MAVHAKAITATLLAFLGALGTAYQDNHVSGQEWIAIATATLTVGGGVWAVPNARRAPRPGPMQEGV
jgi:hypothetical protein